MSNSDKKYVCTKLDGQICKSWEVLDSSPLLPSLTPQQADDLTEAVLYVLVLVFGWAILIKMLR